MYHVGRPSATLADVDSQIAASSSIDPQLRRDLCSAIHCFGQAIGKKPHELPADGSLLRLAARLRRRTVAGPTRDGWASIRRKVGSALILTGHVDAIYFERSQLSPQWRALRAKLTIRTLACELPRLMRYCAARGIVPEQVADSNVAQYVRWVVDQGNKRDPYKFHQELCRVWNHAVEKVPGWPTQRLTVPRRRITVALPWFAFPRSLKADVDAWLRRLAVGDPLASVPIRTFRPTTLRTYEWLVRYFASVLVHCGYDPQNLRSLADLVAIHAVKEGLRYFLRKDKRRSNSYISLLLTVLKNVARTWVRVGKGRWEQLTEISRALAPKPRGLDERSSLRLRPFDDPANVRALLALPQRLARETVDCDDGYRECALEMQIAVAIELLLFCPLRISVLARLELNRHVRAAGDVRAPSIRIIIPAEEMTSGRNLVFVLPAQAARLLTVYVERFRPRLVAGRSRWLFPGAGNRPKGVCALRQRISATIQRTIGLKVNPFLFRHICAKLFLSRNPENYEVVRRVLGHRLLATTSRMYCDFGTAIAIRHFDEKVLGLRRADVVRLAHRWRRREPS